MQLSGLRTTQHTSVDIGLETQCAHHWMSCETIFFNCYITLPVLLKICGIDVWSGVMYDWRCVVPVIHLPVGVYCMRVGVRRRSFDSGEIKRAADGGASIDCCCNYNALLAQSQMKLFRSERPMDADVLLHFRRGAYVGTFCAILPPTCGTYARRSILINALRLCNRAGSLVKCTLLKC